jgi:hypothetical protein
MAANKSNSSFLASVAALYSSSTAEHKFLASSNNFWFLSLLAEEELTIPV